MRRANLGMTLEAALATQHGIYARQRRAFVQQIATPMKQIGTPKDGKGVLAVRSKKSTTDFAGVIGSGAFRGRGVFLEAKSASQDREPFREVGTTRGGLRPHQEVALASAAACGGFGLIIVKMPSGIWLVQIAAWISLANDPKIGRAWTPPLLDAHGKRLAGPYELKVDWLSALSDMNGATDEPERRPG